MNQKQPSASPVLFFAGLIVGSLITAMLTPSSGREVRNKIRTKAEKMSENAKKTAQDIKETQTELNEDLKASATRAIKKASPPSDITPPQQS